MQRFALVMAAALLGACSAQEAAVPLDSEPLHGGALTSGDRAALHALDTAYVKAWLDPDGATRSEALLSLFAPDVVIYPGRGRAPLNGIEELRAYWFAEDFSPTESEYIEHETLAVEGSVALAAITGHSKIAFVSNGRRIAQEGHYIIHARPDDAGYWRIERMMWSARARE